MKSMFICGTGRCGTTILSRMVGQCPYVLNFMETRMFEDKFTLGFGGTTSTFNCSPKDSGKEVFSCMADKFVHGLQYGNKHINPESIREMYPTEQMQGAFIHSFQRTVRDMFTLALDTYSRDVFIEKTPHNVVIADTLLNMFPYAVIVHVIRDPRDIFSSVKHMHWGPSDAVTFCEYYNKIMQKALHAYEIVPYTKYICIQLEMLVKHPGSVLESVFHFADLPYKEEYKKAINPEKAHIGRYKKDLSEEEIEMIKNQCGNIYRVWRNICSQYV